TTNSRHPCKYSTSIKTGIPSAPIEKIRRHYKQAPSTALQDGSHFFQLFMLSSIPASCHIKRMNRAKTSLLSATTRNLSQS
ncbi:MAG: hypothetical protein ACRC16_27030, partial [Aeromonas salmonicida]